MEKKEQFPDACCRCKQYERPICKATGKFTARKKLCAGFQRKAGR